MFNAINFKYTNKSATCVASVTRILAVLSNSMCLNVSCGVVELAFPNCSLSNLYNVFKYSYLIPTNSFFNRQSNVWMKLYFILIILLILKCIRAVLSCCTNDFLSSFQHVKHQRLRRHDVYYPRNKWSLSFTKRVSDTQNVIHSNGIRWSSVWVNSMYSYFSSRFLP